MKNLVGNVVVLAVLIPLGVLLVAGVVGGAAALIAAGLWWSWNHSAGTLGAPVITFTQAFWFVILSVFLRAVLYPSHVSNVVAQAKINQKS